MRHHEARRQLASLMDGVLSSTEDAAVRSHVAECSRCECALLELELSDSLLRRLPAELAPQRWNLAAETRLEAVGAPPRRHSTADGLAFRAVAAAVTVSLVLAITVLGPWRTARTERHGPTGLLASAERQATLIASNIGGQASVHN